MNTFIRKTILSGALFVYCFASTGEAAAPKRPLKVYIMAGQSNMEGHADVRTFEHVGMDPKTAPLLKEMLGPDGQPRVCDNTYIYLGTGRNLSTPVVRKGKLTAGYGANASKIGPEFTFGIYMQKALNEPIMIIKTAWGGKNLYHDFRPPSAGEWKPSDGHPDLTTYTEPLLPIPDTLDLPIGFVPGREYFNPYAGWLGRFLGLQLFRGCEIGEHGGVHPLYVAQAPRQKFTGDPLLAGDVIVGLNGQGLGKDPVIMIRKVISQAMRSTWKFEVTRWRDGKISNVVVDLSESLPNGRADVEKVNKERVAQAAARKKASAKTSGHYYSEMVRHVKAALADIKSVYPDYDPEQGYAIEGFCWLQGWNDMTASGIYPNGNRPRGFEQYSWLLSHFIRDVRNDFEAPDMKFVIGVLGVGGIPEKPNYFREAMAAPAKDPAFKGTVVAVDTGKYWDHQLEALVKRKGKIGDKRRELQQTTKLDKEALNKAMKEYTQQIFTPQELEIANKGSSNADYHYLGSAKIMGQIGKAFAEAMVEPKK